MHGIFSAGWIREVAQAVCSPMISLRPSSSAASLLSISSTVSAEECLVQDKSRVASPATTRSFEGQDDLNEEEIVRLYMKVVKQSCEQPEPTLPASKEKASLFFSVRKPDIPLEFYIRRLITNCGCSKSVFLVALLYLERLGHFDARLKLCDYNLHRLLITSILLAAKFVDDTHYSNAHFARVGGVPSVQEINNLELAMLTFLSFDVNVSLLDYEVLVEDANAGTASPTRIRSTSEVDLLPYPTGEAIVQ